MKQISGALIQPSRRLLWNMMSDLGCYVPLVLFPEREKSKDPCVLFPHFPHSSLSLHCGNSVQWKMVETVISGTQQHCSLHLARGFGIYQRQFLSLIPKMKTFSVFSIPSPCCLGSAGSKTDSPSGSMSCCKQTMKGPYIICEVL